MFGNIKVKEKAFSEEKSSKLDRIKDLNSENKNDLTCMTFKCQTQNLKGYEAKNVNTRQSGQTTNKVSCKNVMLPLAQVDQCC